MSSIPEQAIRSVDPGDNILVMCPSFQGEESNICVELLTPSAPDSVSALSILFTQSPSDHLATWERHSSSFPSTGTIISVDADARSTETSPADDIEDQAHSIDRVTSPQNLTRLGVSITDQLDDLKETATDQQIAVCFRSLSALLQYVDDEQAFKFLQVITDKCTENNAIAHFHMDPRAHDEQTIAMFLELFDTVFEYDGDEWLFRQKR